MHTVITILILFAVDFNSWQGGVRMSFISIRVKDVMLKKKDKLETIAERKYKQM